VPAKRRVPVSDVWRTWPVVRVLAVRDYKVRYKQAALGPLWLIIQPLGILAAFTVVFDGVTQVPTGDTSYPLFALVGITVWTAVGSILTFGVRTNLLNRRLITLVWCPRVAFVTSSLVSALPNLIAPLLLTLLAIPLLGEAIPLAALALPVAVAWLLVLCWVLSLGLSAANVRFRDVNAIVPFLIQGGLLFTPVAYPLSQAPANLQEILRFNPFTGIIEFWRWSLLGLEADWQSVGIAAAMTVVIAIVSWRLFTRLEVRFADLI
jgi:ABC-type polysaccharide/polyol phosphate export permease